MLSTLEKRDYIYVQQFVADNFYTEPNLLCEMDTKTTRICFVV